MKNDKGAWDVKCFVSDKGKNQYLLISADEAAVIDVSDAVYDAFTLEIISQASSAVST